MYWAENRNSILHWGLSGFGQVRAGSSGLWRVRAAHKRGGKVNKVTWLKLVKTGQDWS